MAASLLEQMKSLAPPEVIERLAGGLGETPQATGRALTGAALPAVLGGIEQQFSSGAGPARLLGLIKQQDPGGKLLDNISAGLSGAPPAQGVGEVERAGQGFIGTLFGQRADQVADVVATHGGIKKDSAISLLSIAGAMILGWLGQRVARGGLDAAGLGSMLSNARGELGRIAPPELAGAIGAPGVAEPAGAYAASAATGREAIYHYPAEEAGARKAAAPGLSRSLSWLIPALIVLALIVWLVSRLSGGPHAPARPTTQAPAQAPTGSRPQTRAPAALTIDSSRAPVQAPGGGGLTGGPASGG